MRCNKCVLSIGGYVRYCVGVSLRRNMGFEKHNSIYNAEKLWGLKLFTIIASSSTSTVFKIISSETTSA